MSRRWPFWIVACVSLGAGVLLSATDRRLTDFFQIVAWLDLLHAGVSPFTSTSGSDYPPWALMTLMPLGWAAQALSNTQLAWLWIATNLALVGLLVSRLLRPVPEGDRTRVWLAAALLSAVCFRVLGQFSILSFALAMVGATSRSPMRGGLWLGLALMKPQVGGAIWLAHVLAGDWKRVMTASVLPLVEN